MSDGLNLPRSLTHKAAIPLKLNNTNKTVEACRAAITGQRKGILALLPFLGPAFIASIAYIDPGNFATNVQSGSEFGYRMLWVVVLANLMAMLLQNMSAKLGIATGQNLPELCRIHFKRWLSFTMWGVSEVAAMATDLAEFLGATLGMNLLFGIPMLYAAIVTGLITYLILMLDRYGFRPLEKFIAAFAVLIGACYLIETFLSHPNFAQVAYHSVVPWLGNGNSVMLAVGVIGATVMPHAIYLHSGLTQNRVVPRDDGEKVKLQRFNTKEVLIALGFAGLINIAMMYMAAAAFHSTGNNSVADIQSAYKTLTPILGPASAGVFLISLLFSGISSSVVGTMAGQVIMQGFVGFRIPVWVRRVITMLPTIVIVALGVDPTQTLVISQVILSVVLPIPIIALIYFTKRKDLMGVLVNQRWITVLSIACAFVITFLNLLLIYQTLGGHIPLLG
ncbi:Natural resistance-associated macrophage protein [Acididesulfobacillus acetoxydans]|uniref:Divalent metal cation transporter MntH n=1 Tax=Acididesulfobacillus acetoxydans TaxID=1561005 RepID=A0A8S0WE92_9FIRM|nr:Nramp family divalent metal transporter [Acididesulfobacillus acetoxydans]CAA7599952.1 Natural resistance-associated macrophage protein [Acididesulfobacillus acetoxydans]CEJ07956.1 Natural resistance-associated macrophage protein signature [Acididesulfobacillus acetoxydans]